MWLEQIIIKAKCSRIGSLKMLNIALDCSHSYEKYHRKICIVFFCILSISNCAP